MVITLVFPIAGVSIELGGHQGAGVTAEGRGCRSENRGHGQLSCYVPGPRGARDWGLRTGLPRGCKAANEQEGTCQLHGLGLNV